MGLQFVICSADSADIHAALADAAPHCEIFPIRDGHFGLPIPSKIIGAVGEAMIQQRLARLHRFDLWRERGRRAGTPPAWPGREIRPRSR